MMRRPESRARPKRRTRQHVIADLGINHVERFVLRCGHVVERMQKDYGIDLTLWIFDRSGRPSKGQVFLQVKATERPARLKKSGEMALAVERGDLEGWLNSDRPVILILYDAGEDRAYWLYVQAYFEQIPGFELSNAPAKVTVRFATDHLLTEAAVRKFVRFSNRVLGQQGSVRHDDR